MISRRLNNIKYSVANRPGAGAWQMRSKTPSLIGRPRPVARLCIGRLRLRWRVYDERADENN
eukprot:14229537-Heterocapsa_arctica.AAC.1